MLLFFDRKRDVMTWPGMPAGELGRHVMQHTCTAVAGRTMLSTFYQPEQFDPKRLDPVDAFSLSCPGNTVKYYFITLDRATKVVVLETEAAISLPGNITDIDNGVIKFTFGRGPSDQHDALWDERSRSLTFVGVANNPARPTKVQECVDKAEIDHGDLRGIGALGEVRRIHGSSKSLLPPNRHRSGKPAPPIQLRHGSCSQMRMPPRALLL